MPEIQMPKLSDTMEHRHVACVLSGHFACCECCSEVKLRWPHRLKVKVYVPVA